MWGEIETKYFGMTKSKTAGSFQHGWPDFLGTAMEFIVVLNNVCLLKESRQIADFLLQM